MRRREEGERKKKEEAWVCRCLISFRGGRAASIARGMRPSHPLAALTKSAPMFPMAAAHIVDMPSVAPRLMSIASPASMSMELSMMPKPTKGTA